MILAGTEAPVGIKRFTMSKSGSVFCVAADDLVNSRSYFDVSTHPQTFFYVFLIHGP